MRNFDVRKRLISLLVLLVLCAGCVSREQAFPSPTYEKLPTKTEEPTSTQTPVPSLTARPPVQTATSIPIEFERKNLEIPSGAEPLSISPDGRWIIRFDETSQQRQGRPIELISLIDPGKRLAIPFSPEDDLNYMLFESWSPDSQAFIVSRFAGEHNYVQFTIYRVINGEKIQRSIYKKAVDYMEFDWSFDSTKIVAYQAGWIGKKAVGQLLIFNLNAEIIQEINTDDFGFSDYLLAEPGLFMITSNIKNNSQNEKNIRLYDPRLNWKSNILPISKLETVTQIFGYRADRKELLLIGSHCEECNTLLWVYDLSKMVLRKEFVIREKYLPNWFYFRIDPSSDWVAIQTLTDLYLVNWPNEQLLNAGQSDRLIGWMDSEKGFALLPDSSNSDQVQVVIPDKE